MATSFYPGNFAAPGFRTCQNLMDRIPVSIVEVDENDRRVMGRMLEQSQEFATAGVYGSASEALEEIPKVHSEVVLMDIRLPGMSGIECAKRLKAAYPDLVVIFVAGLCDVLTMTEALEAGGDSYLAKPLSITQFLATLRFVVWQRKINESNRSTFPKPYRDAPSKSKLAFVSKVRTDPFADRVTSPSFSERGAPRPPSREINWERLPKHQARHC